MAQYAFDKLGWLQFEQLAAELLELEAGVGRNDWSGSADRCRYTLSRSGLGAPLLAYELPGPVLIQCAWIHSGAEIALAVKQLATEQPREADDARSYLLICNGDLENPLRAPAGDDSLRVGVLGKRELAARIGAVPELRQTMPSLLGLGALEQLIDPELASGSSLELRASGELADVFVPTRAHRRALDVLAAHRFAVLTGPPEMGKTAIARMIALAKLTCGWQAHECTSPDGVWQAFDPAAPAGLHRRRRVRLDGVPRRRGGALGARDRTPAAHTRRPALADLDLTPGTSARGAAPAAPRARGRALPRPGAGTRRRERPGPGREDADPVSPREGGGATERGLRIAAPVWP